MSYIKRYIKNLPFSNELKEKVYAYISYSEGEQCGCAILGCPENIAKTILVALAFELESNIRFVDCRTINGLENWLETIAEFQENDIIVLLYANECPNILPFVRNSIFESRSKFMFGCLYGLNSRQECDIPSYKYFVIANNKDDIHFELLEAIYSTIDLTPFENELSQFYVSGEINKLLLMNEIDRLTIDKVDNMSGRDFELFAADLFEKLDFTNVSVTSSSGDFGADVIAEKDDIRYAIQCKRYSKPVGISAIQEVIASKSLYDCHVACVLTNNVFTPAAEELAKKNFVVLWGREKLQEFIDKTGC